MAKHSDKEVGFLNSQEFVSGIDDRLPPPGGEDVPALLSKMQLNPGPTDGRKETMKNVESSLNTSN